MSRDPRIEKIVDEHSPTPPALDGEHLDYSRARRALLRRRLLRLLREERQRALKDALAAVRAVKSRDYWGVADAIVALSDLMEKP